MESLMMNCNFFTYNFKRYVLLNVFKITTTATGHYSLEVMSGGQISLTGWADDNVIRDGSATLIPCCALVDSFIGLCFSFSDDVDDKCS